MPHYFTIYVVTDITDGVIEGIKDKARGTTGVKRVIYVEADIEADASEVRSKSFALVGLPLVSFESIRRISGSGGAVPAFRLLTGID